MIIEDVDTEEKFEIGIEQLSKIKEIAIGNVTPQGLLDLFPLFSGSRSKNGKKRIFRYEGEWSKEKGSLIENCDKIKIEIAELNKDLGILKSEEEKLSLEKDSINKRLEEIRHQQFTNNRKINEISLETIPEKQKQFDELQDKFEEITGTRDIELWR